MTTLFLNIADYLVIILMLSVSAFVGLYFRFTGGRQKTTHEFLLAGRNMHVGPVAFSLMATFMSAISILGMPSETYMYGTQYSLWLVGMPIGCIIAAYGLIPVFFDLDVSTAYEYLEKRFGRTTRTITALLFTIQTIFYMAVVLYAPSLALNAVTGLSTWASVMSLAFVCTFYCSLGGMKAVLWTDVFQSFLMYFTIISVVITVTVYLGFYNIYKISKDGGRLIFLNISTDITERYTLWNSVGTGIMFSLKTFGTNQSQIQRLMSVGSLKKAQKALFWSCPLIIIYIFFSFLDGVVVYAMFHDCDPINDKNTNLSSPDQLLAFLIMKLFGNTPGLSGLAVAGIFSASLSTISSAMNSLTAVAMEDFIKPYSSCKNLKESRAALLAKLLAVGYGVVTILITFLVASSKTIMESSNILTGMISGPILAIFILGMFSKMTNEKGMLIGLLAGIIITAWLGFGNIAAKASIKTLGRSIDGCLEFQNTTFLNTTLFDTTSKTTLEAESLIQEERYILSLYRMSYLWIPFVGCAVVLLVGYLVSFLLSFWMDSPEVQTEYLSPFIRKFYLKPVNSKVLNKSEIEMDMMKPKDTDKTQTNEMILES